MNLPVWLHEQANFFERELGLDYNDFIDEAIEHSLTPHMGD